MKCKRKEEKCSKEKEKRENFIVLLFHYLYAIHTKYTYKIFKKDDLEARE